MGRRASLAAIVAVLGCFLLGFCPAQRTALAGCTAFPYVSALVTAPNGSLLAGTRDGHLYRSVIGGLCWAELTSFPNKVEIGTLLVPPGRPHTILAGGSWVASVQSQSRVLYRSDDDGQTWSSATAGLPHTAILPVTIAASQRGTLVLSFICPQAYQSAQAKGLCPQGLARSVDGGRSWHPVGPPVLENRNVIAMPDGTFLALLEMPGKGSRAPGSLYHSVDDGRTWQPVIVQSGTGDRNALDDLGGISAFFAVPWQPTNLLIGTDLRYFTATVYRSQDGGGHWSVAWSAREAKVKSAFSEPAVVSFAALPRTHTLLFSDLGGVYRSVDAGSTWTRTTIRPTTDTAAPSQFWTLLAAPDGATAYAGSGAGVFRSGDDGKTWTRLL
jgi:photosystem II stability/assembly factor-like uncharacterized protein